MSHTVQTVSLPAPPEQVWAVAADPDRFGDWLTMHRSWVGGTPTSITAGDQAAANVRVANLPFTVTWTVDEYTPPSRVRLRGRGPAGVEVSITMDIEAVEKGSTLTIGLQLDGALVGGPVGQVVERAAARELAASTARLRELVA